MKVSELIEILKKCDPDGTVFVVPNTYDGYISYESTCVMESKMNGNVFIEAKDDNNP